MLDRSQQSEHVAYDGGKNVWKLSWLNFDMKPDPKNPFVCPKEGITPTFLFFSDGIVTLNPILGRGLDS